jgi:septal ring factor EnvC (AmiA/AmiB activator)
VRVHPAFLVLLTALSLGSAPASGQALRGEQAGVGRDLHRAQAEVLAREVEDLRRQLIRLGGAQSVDEGQALRQRARLERLHRQELALKEDIGANRTRLARLLGALQLYQRDPPPPLFVHARSARNAARAAVLMKAVTPELHRRGRALSVRADAIRKVRRQVAEASELLFLTESELADRRAEIERLIAEKSGLERRLLGDAGQADAAARELAARANSLEDLVSDLGALDRAPRSAAPMALSPPVQGRLVRRFGEPAALGRSEGVAWRAGRNAQVLAPTDARVEYVGPLKGYGLVVILRTGEPYHVVLAGLEEAASGAGRSVVAGEPIGRMANGAPELYLEVRRGGEPVDPARWLQGVSQPARGGRS